MDSPEIKPLIPYPAESTFDPSDWAILSRCWFPIAVADEVADAPVKARLLDVDLVVFRGADGLAVAHDVCPHRGMILSRGWVSDGQLVCPYHGLHFGGDGRCALIPSQPEGPIPERLALTLLPCVERFGLIWTCLAGGEPHGLPPFEAWDDETYQQIVCPVVDIAGSPGRQVEGFLDVAHFAWAHMTTFGDRSNPVVPAYKVERTKTGARATYVSQVSNYGPGQRHLAPEDFLWTRTFEVFPPFSARLIVDFPDGGQLWILNAASPVSARMTRLFCPLTRNFHKHTSVEDVREFNRRVFNEDRVLVESQRPKDLPLDSHDETHIAADRTSIAYRRILREMGLKLTARAD